MIQKTIYTLSLLLAFSFCAKAKSDKITVKSQILQDTIAVEAAKPPTRKLERPANEKIDEKALVSFLQERLTYYDSNPIHQEDADEMNAFMHKVLAQKYSEEDVKKLRGEALALLYDNSVGSYEDSPDVRRYIFRRYLSFLSLALLSDEWRYPQFLSDADSTMEGLDFENERVQRKVLISMVHVLILQRDSENHSEWMVEREVDYFLNHLERAQEVIDDEAFVAGCLSVFKKEE